MVWLMCIMLPLCHCVVWPGAMLATQLTACNLSSQLLGHLNNSRHTSKGQKHKPLYKGLHRLGPGAANIPVLRECLHMLSPGPLSCCLL